MITDNSNKKEIQNETSVPVWVGGIMACGCKVGHCVHNKAHRDYYLEQKELEEREEVDPSWNR